MTQNPCYTKLHARGLIKVFGNDAKTFLQGLITNDIALLDSQPSVYACLLTPQGKFLFDFFITQDNDTFILECEGGGRAQDLAKRLSVYKLRSDVTIEVHESVDVYAVFGTEVGTPDPRHKNMGYRSFTKPQDIEETPFEGWDKRRIELCLPDGNRDLITEKSTMDEAHMDQLNAISYDKGCYVGQELTARMHYRGLGKKHLQTVRVDELPDGAELRSSCGGIGIALVRTKAKGKEA